MQHKQDKHPVTRPNGRILSANVYTQCQAEVFPVCKSLVVSQYAYFSVLPSHALVRHHQSLTKCCNSNLCQIRSMVPWSDESVEMWEWKVYTATTVHKSASAYSELRNCQWKDLFAAVTTQTEGQVLCSCRIFPPLYPVALHHKLSGSFRCICGMFLLVSMHVQVPQKQPMQTCSICTWAPDPFKQYKKKKIISRFLDFVEQ